MSEHSFRYRGASIEFPNPVLHPTSKRRRFVVSIPETAANAKPTVANLWGTTSANGDASYYDSQRMTSSSPWRPSGGIVSIPFGSPVIDRVQPAGCHLWCRTVYFFARESRVIYPHRKSAKRAGRQTVRKFNPPSLRQRALILMKGNPVKTVLANDLYHFPNSP